MIKSINQLIDIVLKANQVMVIMIIRVEYNKEGGNIKGVNV
jgi:hypothetical protein